MLELDEHALAQRHLKRDNFATAGIHFTESFRSLYNLWVCALSASTLFSNQQGGLILLGFIRF